MKKLYYRLEADDYNVIMDLSGCFEWIKSSVQDVERGNLFDTKESEMPEYIITPVWMTDEEFSNLEETD